MAANRTFIGTETLTGLLYSIFCPLIFGQYTEQAYPGESGMVYILLFFTALINFIILSTYLNKKGKIGFVWLGLKVLIGIVIFETFLQLMLGTSFLYDPMGKDRSEVYLFFLSNTSSLIIFYGLNTLVLRWRSRCV